MPDTGQGWAAVDDLPAETPQELDSQTDLFLRQRDVLGMEELYYRRLLDGVADSKQITFGGGALPEVTLIGDVHERYAGAGILNYSGAQLNVGFAASAGLFTAFVVEPGMWMLIPQNYTELSVAVSAAVAAGPVQNPITVVRTYVPPIMLQAGTLTTPGLGVADTVTAMNATTQPAAGAILAQTPPLPGGVYQAVVLASVESGAALLDVRNIQVLNGATVIGGVLPGLSVTEAPTASTFRATVAPGAQLATQAIALATAGCSYLTSIQATRIL